MLKYEISERNIDLGKKKPREKNIIEINSVLWGGKQ